MCSCPLDGGIGETSLNVGRDVDSLMERWRDGAEASLSNVRAVAN
ncbi:hypothetical protein [Rubritalea tangerina]